MLERNQKISRRYGNMFEVFDAHPQEFSEFFNNEFCNEFLKEVDIRFLNLDDILQEFCGWLQMSNTIEDMIYDFWENLMKEDKKSFGDCVLFLDWDDDPTGDEGDYIYHVTVHKIIPKEIDDLVCLIQNYCEINNIPLPEILEEKLLPKHTE